MPVLNEVVLESIFNELVHENTEQNLLKFMLCGKEVFKSAVNCFKRTNAIEFLQYEFIVQFNDTRFKISSYNFVLVKIIKKAVESSAYLKELVIGQWPVINSGKSFLYSSLQKDLKIFGLREKVLEFYIEIIKNKTTIEEIRFLYFVTYDDLHIIPASCRILKVFFKPHKMMKDVPQSLNISHIKNVFVLDEINYDLTPEKVQSFKHFVKNCFPDLKPSISCVCTTQAVCTDIQRVFNAQMFAAVSSTNTNKHICFCSLKSKDYISVAIKLFGFPLHSNCGNDTRITVHSCLLPHIDPTYVSDEESDADDDEMIFQ